MAVRKWDTSTLSCIAFPVDYDWSAMNRILVGTAGDNTTAASSSDDVFRIHGGVYPTLSAAYDLAVRGTSYDCNVRSIAISGDIAEADVLVGRTDATAIYLCSNPTTSTISWVPSTKAPTGDPTTPNTIVLMAPDYADSKTAYVGTEGNASAFSQCTDGGVTFNQLSLIDVSGTGNLSLVDSAIADANTMFLIMADSGGPTGAQ